MASNAELESRVQERTAALVAANQELQRSNEALAQERARVQAANDELERLNQDLEQFMYSASHDLREPIRNVLIYTQLLERRYGGLFDDKGREYLAFVTGGAGRLDRLLSDLLSYSRLAGPQADESEVADGNMALASAQADLAEIIRQTGATIQSETLPSVRIRQGNLEQLFLNLLGNGLKYRSDEPPVIHVRWQQEGAFCCFAIRDNGIGIEPDYQDKIFGLFKRLHRDTEYPGTGIGLAICKRVVERYGGRIWVHSQSGQGSTFYFTVPMAAVAVAGASTVSLQRVL